MKQITRIIIMKTIQQRINQVVNPMLRPSEYVTDENETLPY